jgi:hypothetical protein
MPSTPPAGSAEIMTWSLRCGVPLLAASVIAAAASCETLAPHACDPAPNHNPEQTFDGGTVMNGVYMSSSWDGELLNFPGGMHYRLEHHLGGRPTWVQPYLSFDENGTRDGGALGQAVGNQVEILGIDCQTIEISNDSCVDYWLLLTAGGAPPSCDAGPVDAAE